MVGQTLRHYRIETKLGAGGMGIVYRARDTRLDRSIAIKVLPVAASYDAERKGQPCSAGEATADDADGAQLRERSSTSCDAETQREERSVPGSPSDDRDGCSQQIRERV